ncbi:MAG: 16S rRNA (guanine1516-N2)-methyltransferase [Porticoccus sp.]|jgi:16S rRNA (guanine1516-N2)-methyltransferase
MSDSKVIVFYSDDNFADAAKGLAQTTGLPVKKGTDLKFESVPFCLCVNDLGISLRQSGKKAPGPVRVDFLAGKTKHRMNYGGGRGQLLSKAIGVNKRAGLKVLDATAGLGQDSFVLATLGCDMTLIERSPVVAALLRDGIERGLQGDDEVAAVLGRMNLVCADSIDYLQQLAEPVDVIYLDPMYPHTDKTAKVKKEMAVFREIVGQDLDNEKLLAEALEKAIYRVVVKRPRLGAKISSTKPTLQLMGKSSRFDIYTNKGLS